MSHTVSIDINGQPFSLETGKVAKQADGAVVVRYGGTMVLATCVGAKSAREAQDFFPRPNTIDPGFARDVLRGAELWLVGDGRRLRLEAFEVDGLPDWRIDWLLPGWPARGLDPLPPGEWTLRAERDGKVPFETRVRIEAGQVTTVRW